MRCPIVAATHRKTQIDFFDCCRNYESRRTGTGRSCDAVVTVGMSCRVSCHAGLFVLDFWNGLTQQFATRLVPTPRPIPVGQY